MTGTPTDAKVDDVDDLTAEFVQLARLALAGREQDVQTYIQRCARRWRRSRPAFGDALRALAVQSPSRSSPLRDFGRGLVEPAPVDTETRAELVRHELTGDLDVAPILTSANAGLVSQLVAERRRRPELEAAGLEASKTVLFTGPPGVGKTLTARKIAADLDLPLLVLDLAGVMSSLLGRTGNNLRQVLNYAKTTPSVLLLDEIDSVAKRRDDTADVGELKRLVTVLLQAIDDWPSSGLLIAATNHPALLDPALWRRFDMLISFDLPNYDMRYEAIGSFLGDHSPGASPAFIESAAITMEGLSFSDIRRTIMGVRRSAVIHGRSVSDVLDQFIREHATTLDYTHRLELAIESITRRGLSQRAASQVFGVSRDSIRKHRNSSKDGALAEVAE